MEAGGDWGWRVDSVVHEEQVSLVQVGSGFKAHATEIYLI